MEKDNAFEAPLTDLQKTFSWVDHIHLIANSLHADYHLYY